jgi:flavin reductase (DIM6/NTAB) family NADH-FMN oxidoreductase RutF
MFPSRPAGEVRRRLAGPVDERIDGPSVTTSDDGALTFDEGLARFDCTVYREVEAGTAHPFEGSQPRLPVRCSQ